MRKLLLISLVLLASLATVAETQISFSIGSPNLRLGLAINDYPQLVPIRGYPVYYAPHLDSNYFFYDGLYWVYLDDNWYASSWYNGPWSYVDPYVVPVYILRVPVRYYRRPPVHFHGYIVDAPPRWDEHWGREWHERRHGWDRWDRRHVPQPLPLPTYQRKYSGERYPDVDYQRDLQRQYYRYQPRNPVVAAHYQNERDQDEVWRHQSQQERERAARERREQADREEQQQVRRIQEHKEAARGREMPEREQAQHPGQQEQRMESPQKTEERHLRGRKKDDDRDKN